MLLVVLGDTQALVFVELGAVRHLASVGAQLGRQQVLQPCGLVDSLLADENEHLLVDDLVAEPRSDHRLEPFPETVHPELLFLLAAGDGHAAREPGYPVGLVLGVVNKKGSLNSEPEWC